MPWKLRNILLFHLSYLIIAHVIQAFLLKCLDQWHSKQKGKTESFYIKFSTLTLLNNSEQLWLVIRSIPETFPSKFLPKTPCKEETGGERETEVNVFWEHTSVGAFWIEKGLTAYCYINPNMHNTFLFETGDKNITCIPIPYKKEYKFEKVR